MIAEAPMTFETETVISQEPEISDLVPSETPAWPIIEPVGGSSFPKVLRSRLDSFFAEQDISPKADRTMRVKIAAGLAVLAGSWIALYALRPGSWKFVALYLLGGLAQTFLLLNIAHDSNHNAISSR
jgi:linoleoyl-CoA desaturase